jgi:hypothetical protein
LNSNQLNSEMNFSNTATSFAKGAPNFNSLAFNSGNNFGTIQTGQMNNKYTSNATPSNIHQKTNSANNLNAMILPETNFTGYKNLINYNQTDMINLNKESPRSSPNENTDSGNISKIFLFILEYGNSNFNSNANNYNAKTNQLNNLLGIYFTYYHTLLGHKYGSVSSQKAENYNYINNNINSHDFQNYTKNLNSNSNLNNYEVKYHVKIYLYSFLGRGTTET